MRPNTIKLLEESIGRTPYDINCINIFFNPSPRVIEIKTKISKWDLLSSKAFAQFLEGNDIQRKIQPTDWKKIFSNIVTVRD